MKQLLLNKGEMGIEDVPAPAKNPHHVLVQVSKSLISTGTEISHLKMSQESLIQKTQKNPGKILKLVDSIRVGGIKKTFSLVENKLNQFEAMGYSCAGRILQTGKLVTVFQPGDRVACAGSNMASHAEVVSIPANLVVKLPAEVSDQEGAFITVGAIALQGVRRADVKLGELVCVMGLGLIGQITVQILNSAGCRVIGFDPDPDRVEHGIKFGMWAGTSNATELQKLCQDQSGGHGADATIITASTESSHPTQNSFEITRRKGKIVVVGAVGMDLKRSPFYEKEQDFLISCSYGPGRYDPQYENYNQDYPYSYVRWTENRNMEAFVDLIQRKKVNVQSLVGNEYPFLESEKAYQALQAKGKKPLALVLNYPHQEKSMGEKAQTQIKVSDHPGISGKIRLGMVGGGEFTRSTHIPNLKILNQKVEIRGVCASHGPSVKSLGKIMKASLMTTDYNELIHHPEIDGIFIATRHDNHAAITMEALKNGKHVFVEKPLALEISDLKKLNELVGTLSTCPTLMVGFNRRFSPLFLKLHEALKNRKSPLIGMYIINAGTLPPDHWTQGPEGGGRLRGEACHMIDLFQAAVGVPLQQTSAWAIHGMSGSPLRPDENFNAQFLYQDGSLCNLVYLTVGNDQLPKERLEFHWEGKSAVLEDFKKLTILDSKKTIHSIPQDKGHLAILREFIQSISNGISFPIPWADLSRTTQAAIELNDQVWGHAPHE